MKKCENLVSNMRNNVKQFVGLGGWPAAAGSVEPEMVMAVALVIKWAPPSCICKKLIGFLNENRLYEK